MKQSSGPLAVENFPGNHFDFSTYLSKRARAQSGACAEVQFPDYGTVLWSPGSRIYSRKALRFQDLSWKKERELSIAHAQRCIFVVMEQFSGPLAVEMIPGKQESTAISAPILPRGGELSLFHAQRCSFLIMEHCCGPLAVEFFPGKHCDFSTYLTKSRELSLAHALRFNFLIMEQCCGPLAVKFVPGNTAISALILPREREISLAHAQRCNLKIMELCCGHMAVEIIPGNHCDFRTYLTKRARAQSGACAEVQFPDYGTGLWSPGSRNCSRKALRFQHLSYKESENSVWRMCRGAIS
jgi:hypothetical protein